MNNDNTFLINETIMDIKKENPSLKKINRQFYLLYTNDCKYENGEYITTDKVLIEILMIEPSTGNIIGTGMIDPELKNLEQFIIDSRYRRQGYGERFIKFVIRKFDVNNLRVITTNKNAIRLYEKCGFKKVDKKFEDSTWMYEMKLQKVINLESYLI